MFEKLMSEGLVVLLVTRFSNVKLFVVTFEISVFEIIFKIFAISSPAVKSENFKFEI